MSSRASARSRATEAPAESRLTDTGTIERRSGGSWKLSLLFMLAVLSPSAVILPMQSPRISALRGLLLVMFIPSLVRLVGGVAHRERLFRGSDLVVMLACLWLLMALTVTEGLAVALVSGNLYVLEFLGAYVMCRAYYSTPEDFKVLFKYLGYCVVAVVLIGLSDHIFRDYFVLNKLTSLVGAPALSAQFRNGVVRAQAIFDHPILYGTFCAFCAILLFYSARSIWSGLIWFAIAGFGSFLSQSSAPLLSLALGFGLIICDHVLQKYRWRWKLIVGLIGAFIVLLFFIDDRPVAFLIRNFTLDPQTGYYRLLIWQYGGAEAMGSPLVGIGFRDWHRLSWMGPSVDSLWLGLAMNYGIPCSALFALALIAAMRQPYDPRVEITFDPYLARVGQALSIVLGLVIFTCFTVYFWSAMWTFLGALVGLRASVSEAYARSILRAGNSGKPSERSGANAPDAIEAEVPVLRHARRRRPTLSGRAEAQRAGRARLDRTRV